MATIVDAGWPNLQNVVKRMAPDGSVESQMVDFLSKKIPMIEDAPSVEGNLPTGHRVTSIYGVAPPTWRRLNEGVKPTKGETEQYDETCGMLEDYSNVDVDAAKLNGNEAAYRASEDRIKLGAMGREAARAVLYQSSLLAPETIHGLAPRYTGASGSKTADYVLKKGSRNGTNCESVWLVNWDPDHNFLIYPKGSTAGLLHEDLGKKLIQKSDGSQLLAYVTHYQWKLGLCVKDYRYNVRMQWDPDDSSNFADSMKTMYLALQEMIGTVEDIGPGARFYMSRVSFNKLNAQLASNDANFLTWLTAGGRLVPSFLGIPIRIDDTLVGESAL